MNKQPLDKKLAIDLSELDQKEVVKVREMLEDMGITPFGVSPMFHYSCYYITNISLSGKPTDNYFYCRLDNTDKFDKNHFITYYELEEIYKGYKDA